jgi:hypothetical protein
MKQNTGITIAAIIILLVAFYLFTRNNRSNAPATVDEQQTRDQATNTPPTTPLTPTSLNTLLISAQVAGSTTTVDNVVLAEPGFVVIHERMSDGEAGKIIGTSNLLSAGTKQDLEINVPLKAGLTYIAMLHKDNGDKKFSEATDEAIVGSDGMPVMKTFTVAK